MIAEPMNKLGQFRFRHFDDLASERARIILGNVRHDTLYPTQKTYLSTLTQYRERLRVRNAYNRVANQ